MKLNIFIFWLQVTAKVSSVYPKNAEAKRCGVEDMTRLAYLHEPGVLQNLKSRFAMNEIYVSLVVQHISSSFYAVYSCIPGALDPVL